MPDKKYRGLKSDIKRLFQAMDHIAEGHCEEVDISCFRNPVYGEKLNAVIRSMKKANNTCVMRLNETMEAVGDNSLIRETFDQVTSQTEAIRQMENASQSMEQAIQNISASMSDIRDNTYHMLTSFQAVTQNMNDSIRAVSESSASIQKINGQMQDFKEKIDRIGKIIDIVKQIASQSNLLALNASIEASHAGEEGAGFSIVAQEMRNLANSTSKSAENITDYVRQLYQDTEILAVSMNDTAGKLDEGNQKAGLSLRDMEQMSCQLDSIHKNVDGIFADMDTQTNSTRDFSGQIDRLSESYNSLSKDCIALGRHVFQIGRYIDKTRSDMVRHNSVISDLDWLRVFEVDHFVLMWRVYNNIVGFERLLAKQVNNPAKCKLGIWLSGQTDPRITGSDAFLQLKNTHIALHEYAFRSWQAKENGDERLAMDYFHKTYDSFASFGQAIRLLQNYLHSIGYEEHTEVPAFEKVPGKMDR